MILSELWPQIAVILSGLRCEILIRSGNEGVDGGPDLWDSLGCNYVYN